MDWKSITSSLDPLTDKLNPYLDKAKDFGYRALDFTQKQLQNTPIVLKDFEDYTRLRTSKRFILIAYDEQDPLSREIILRSPVWSAQAWSDATELRFVEISHTPEIIKTLQITTPLDMRVWYIGNETFHGTSLSDIQAWWKTRSYDGSDIRTPSVSIETPVSPSTDGVIDPLAGK